MTIQEILFYLLKVGPTILFGIVLIMLIIQIKKIAKYPEILQKNTVARYIAEIEARRLHEENLIKNHQEEKTKIEATLNNEIDLLISLEKDFDVYKFKKDEDIRMIKEDHKKNLEFLEEHIQRLNQLLVEKDESLKQLDSKIKLIINSKVEDKESSL